MSESPLRNVMFFLPVALKRAQNIRSFRHGGDALIYFDLPLLSPRQIRLE